MNKISRTTEKRFNAVVYKRDSYRCVLCYATPVQIHHIVYRSAHIGDPYKVWRLKNMCCLCISCHDRIHYDKDFEKINIPKMRKVINERHTRRKILAES